MKISGGAGYLGSILMMASRGFEVQQLIIFLSNFSPAFMYK